MTESTRKGGLIRLPGGRKTKQILRLLLLRKLVETRHGIQIIEAAEMLGCKPRDVGRILTAILKETPEPKKVWLFYDRRKKRISMSGVFLFSKPIPRLRTTEWPTLVRYLKRRARWKEARKLPVPPKTFTSLEAAKIWKLPPVDAQRHLEELSTGPYVNAFFLSGEPVFWQRAF